MNCDCGKETRDEAYACDDCTEETAKALGQVVWIDAELETTIGKVKAAGDAGPASAETALPINVAASAKRTALRHALVMAVRFCSEEGVRHRCEDNDLPDDNLIAMSRWLLWRVDGLALVDMGPGFMRDLIGAVRGAEQIIDLPPDRRYAGPCPECKRDLYHRPDAAQVSCSRCGQRWNVAEVVAWMQARLDEYLADRLVTVKEARTLLGRCGLNVPANTIESWNRRGRLAEHGDNPRVYRWDDLRDLAIEHATRKGA